MVATAMCACGQPSPDAYLCRTCTRELQLALIAAAIYGPQLEIARSRQARIGERNGGRTHGHPLPYDVRAADAGDHLAMVLGGVLRDLNLPEARPA